MNDLIHDFKVKIIKTLDLVNVAPDDIDDDAPIIGSDLGIDSIDVLELVMMIEKDYAVRIDNKELGVKVFASVRALTTYVHENTPLAMS